MNNLTVNAIGYIAFQLQQRVGTEILGGEEELEDIIFARYREDGHIHALMHERGIEELIMRDWDEYRDVVTVLIEEGILTEETSNPFINPRIVLDIVYQEMIYWLIGEINLTRDLGITANGVWLNDQVYDRMMDKLRAVRHVDSVNIRQPLKDERGELVV